MIRFFRLPKTATAPFCPPEVQASVPVKYTKSFWKNLSQFLGPGLLVSVGYMDPGNWATDIEAGSRFGYQHLSVILASSMIAIFLQILCARLGIVTKRDLAQHSRAQFSRPVNLLLWVLAEIAIIACDLAEILGAALAFHLLFGVSIFTGVLLTAFDTLLVLALQGKGFRRLEAIVLGLVGTIFAVFFVEIYLFQPSVSAVAQGLLFKASVFTNKESLYLAIGILGATVMPHNLYLHSAIVQTRAVGVTEKDKARALHFVSIDTVLSLGLAFLVNSAILILAATAFHELKQIVVTDIGDAHKLLQPLTGGVLAPILFALALLAAGQSSTLTGTIAGQVVMEGYLDLKIPSWLRRVVTRGLALAPALVGVYFWGDASVGKLLVLSQVVLSFQLPFAIAPLLLFTSQRKKMGNFTNHPWVTGLGIFLTLAISAANMWLLSETLGDLSFK
jgi:manganese transport protein